MVSYMRLGASIVCLATFFAGCTDGRLWAPTGENARITQGPPIEDIVTPFDVALECLKPRMNRGMTFAVGAVLDQTGRQSMGDQGMGAYFTQGGGEMIQSALLRTGATVINRRNMDIPVTEARWGIRGLETQATTTFFISGSINSLDFIPGGGVSAIFAGIGPRYRQNRILVGADIYMTDARTGVIIGSVPIQKQVVASEVGFSVGRFVGNTLTDVDGGMVEREALHFVLRQMLSLATFELVSLTMEPRHWLPCRAKLDATYGALSATRGAEIETLVREELERLRGTDPRAAMILERELSGESIEDIMESLGEPMPRRAAAPQTAAQAAPAAAAPPAPSSPPAQGATTEATAVPPAPDTALTSGPLTVTVTEGDDDTRVTVVAPPATDLRWGFMGNNLVVVAMGHDGAFDLSGVASGIVSSRVTGFRAGGEGFRRVLQIAVGCNDCGAFGELNEEGVLVLDIARGEERRLLDPESLTPRE